MYIFTDIQTVIKYETLNTWTQWEVVFPTKTLMTKGGQARDHLSNGEASIGTGG